MPYVWLLLGHKQGDNNQVLALAEALGWPAKQISLNYRSYEIVTNLLLRKTCLGLMPSARKEIKSPWPDLILTAGRRNEPVARWIQASAGGAPKIVHLGRAWTHPKKLDLMVTTPQYSPSPEANVVINTLPLHRVSHQKLQTEKTLWADRFASLPRPLHVLLIAGKSATDQLDEGHAQTLIRTVNTMVANKGGSLLVTTSARTPPGVDEIVQNGINVPNYTFSWRTGNDENPYFAYLAHGDEFIVTEDSISMLTEACFTGCPVHMFRFSHQPTLVHRLTQRLVPKRMRRDVSIMHNNLVATGRAVWLGDDWRPHQLPPIDDTERTVAAVKSLFRKQV